MNRPPIGHYRQLRQLMPLDLGAESDKDMQIEGALYDAVSVAAGELEPEILPGGVSALTIERWEAEYGIIPPQGASLEDRRRAVAAKYRYIGSLTKAHFAALAAGLGYEVEITESEEAVVAFRAGISKAGDMVWSVGGVGGMWVWRVVCTNKPPAEDIINLLNDLNPPHMRLLITG